MAYQVNQHVKRLTDYQPFDASFGQLYAEFSDTKQSDQLDTKAFQFVSTVVHDPNVRLVILTGDAGHGKTHLCGQLLTSVDGSVSDPRELLNERGDGTAPLATLPDGRALHVVKDLSEIEADKARQILDEASGTAGRVTVVCANEGRLRAVLTGSSPVRAALDDVLRVGTTSVQGAIHVVDMNHQSVAAHGGKSLVRQSIHSWASDRRKWTTCEQCDARPVCPIYENHRLLSAADAGGESRRSGLETLLRVVEQTGHVVTIRELLIFVAHAITGGIDCNEVERLATSRRHGWQAAYMFHQVAFGTRLSSGDRDRFRVFRATSMLDPGRRAIRPVDDSLDLERNGEAASRFVPDSDVDSSPTPRTVKQARAQAEERRRVYEFLRRESYFEARSDDGTADVPFAERLGLRYYDDFEYILGESVDPQTSVPVRNRVMTGLEAVQGARRGDGAGVFVVVDPAFTSHRGSAAIVARKLTLSSIKLISQHEWWSTLSGSTPNLPDAVDWVDRRIYVLFSATGRDGVGSAPIALDLDCRQFEFVCRAAQGLTNRTFYQADIRRIMARLAELAVGTVEGGEITVLTKGQTAQLFIDVGDVIQATRS